MPTPNAHARLSASSAARWLACPASVRLTEGIADESSPYAAEGTLAHSIGELKLRKMFFPMKKSEYDKEMKRLMADPMYKPEMQSCTDEYLGFVQSILHGMSPDMFEVVLEGRVDYSAYAPGGFGTSDCTILHKLCPDPEQYEATGTIPNLWALHIVDYKHGKGVSVSAVENSQLKLYALGALLKIEAEDELNYLLEGTPKREIEVINTHIVQPRSPDGNSSFSLTRDELLAWAEDVVRPGAAAALAGNCDPVPGEWCRSHFCPIRSTCRARVKQILTCMFDDRLMQDAKTLSADEVAELLDITEDIVPWRKGLWVEGFKIANRAGLPGYKVVRGRSDRAWKDTAKAAKVLSKSGLKPEEITAPAELLSPAQIEGLLGKEKFKEVVGDLVEKPEGRATLAPESDRRSAINQAQDDFKGFLP